MALRIEVILGSKTGLLENMVFLLPEIFRYHSRRNLKMFHFKLQGVQTLLWSQRAKCSKGVLNTDC